MGMIVGNGTLVTFGAECRLIPDGALFLDKGLIAAMGQTAELRAAHPRAAFLDARGQYIMPGMICAHTHTYGAFARGMALKDAPPQSFVQILERLWWRLDRALRPDDIYYSALVCLVDAIRHGTTTLLDHHASPSACAGSLDILAQAFRQAGVRGCLSYEVSDREGREKAREGIRENERFARWVRLSPPAPLPSLGEGGGTPSSPQGEGENEGGSPLTQPSSPQWGEGEQVPLLAAMMGLHAGFTLSDETLLEAAATARDLGVGCHIHVAEDQADVRASLEAHGLRPVQRLARLGVLGPRMIAAHCVHVDDDELGLLAETGTLIVHNPRSNMNNAVGTARVADMLARGITVGLGNDGFSNDMFSEMKTAYLAHKAATGNPQVMPADVVQRLAFSHNAWIATASFCAPALPARFGELSVGTAADVIIVDYCPPTPMTSGNLPWHLIFGVEGGMVTTTIVNGRVLMRDRELLTLDEELIFARAREQAAALWQRL